MSLNNDANWVRRSANSLRLLALFLPLPTVFLALEARLGDVEVDDALPGADLIRRLVSFERAAECVRP